jgi:hypothetical protein
LRRYPHSFAIAPVSKQMAPSLSFSFKKNIWQCNQCKWNDGKILTPFLFILKKRISYCAPNMYVPPKFMYWQWNNKYDGISIWRLWVELSWTGLQHSFKKEMKSPESFLPFLRVKAQQEGTTYKPGTGASPDI